jgi:RNA polymerase sigma-70 factor (ECF subfamily)
MAGQVIEDARTVEDDRMIVAQVVAGHKEEFRLLVRRYERAVFGMGLSFFRNRDDAADFTQDVFLKTFRSLGRFEGRSRFSTWLYKIAYNTAVNSLKRNREYRSLAEGDMPVDNHTPERDLLRSVVKDAITEAVTGLPERYRLCVDLYFFYDRSYQEIETITGFPINTVKSHVFRAKKLLRGKLEDYTEGETE